MSTVRIRRFFFSLLFAVAVCLFGFLLRQLLSSPEERLINDLVKRNTISQLREAEYRISTLKNQLPIDSAEYALLLRSEVIVAEAVQRKSATFRDLGPLLVDFFFSLCAKECSNDS